jgi:hypothetical protein
MKDSLVAIPKTIAIWMAQDVERARSYQQEILMLTGVLDTKENLIGKQDTIIGAYKAKVSGYVNQLGSCQDLNENYEFEIMGLKKNVKKQTNQKKFWRATSVILPIIVGTWVHLDWKYGK